MKRPTFTKYQSNGSNTERFKTLHQDPYFHLINYNKWTFEHCEQDLVMAIPYLELDMTVVFHMEWVPSYEFKSKQKHHLVAITGQIDPNEEPEQTLFRELAEEAGINVVQAYNRHEKISETFIAKNGDRKLHVYWVPLLPNEYEHGIAQGDGSKFEQESGPVFIKTSQLDQLKPADIITQYAIQVIKDKIKVQI